MHWQKAVKEDAQNVLGQGQEAWLHDRAATEKHSSFSSPVREGNSLPVQEGVRRHLQGRVELLFQLPVKWSSTSLVGIRRTWGASHVARTSSHWLNNLCVETCRLKTLIPGYFSCLPKVRFDQTPVSLSIRPHLLLPKPSSLKSVSQIQSVKISSVLRGSRFYGSWQHVRETPDEVPHKET